MKTRDLIKMLDEGLKPIIVFMNMEVSDYDPDNDMMGKVVSYNLDENTVRFCIDVEHNKTHAKRDWYDQWGNPELTWFESNFYPKDNITEVWKMLDTDLLHLEIKEKPSLFEEFQSQTKFTSYVRFLEEKILSSQNK